MRPSALSPLYRRPVLVFLKHQLCLYGILIIAMFYNQKSKPLCAETDYLIQLYTFCINALNILVILQPNKIVDCLFLSMYNLNLLTARSCIFNDE